MFQAAAPSSDHLGLNRALQNVMLIFIFLPSAMVWTRCHVYGSRERLLIRRSSGFGIQHPGP